MVWYSYYTTPTRPPSIFQLISGYAGAERAFNCSFEMEMKTNGMETEEGEERGRVRDS